MSYMTLSASPLSTIALLFLSYLAYRITQSLITRGRFHAFARQHGCEEPPDVTGPFPFKSWSFIWRMIRAGDAGEDVLDDILGPDFKKYHTLKKTAVDGSTMFLTCDPANMQAMFATKFTDFETGLIRRAIMHPLLGNSIFSSDGAVWKHSRALLRPYFSRDNINNLAATQSAADTLIRIVNIGDGKVSGRGETGEDDVEANNWTQPTDLLPLFFNFTMDTSTEFLFGEELGALAAVERERSGLVGKAGNGDLSSSGNVDVGYGAVAASNEFADALRIANDGLVMRLRLQNLYWLGDGLAFRRATRTVWRFVDGFVGKALAKVDSEGKGDGGGERDGGDVDSDGDVNAKKKSKGKRFGLLESLLEQTRDREELIAQTLSVMMAGRDTTAALLGWSLLRLTLHPSIYSDLRATILRDFPAADSSPPTFSQLKSCRPLQHFLQEVLRLHPTVPINNRLCVKDTTLPLGGGPDLKSPIAICAGQLVVFSVYAMHRREDLWGEDALEFRPGRWGEKEKVPGPWAFLPFLGGPRVCLGQQFALTEAGFLIVRLLRRFDGVEALDEGEMERMRKGLGLTMWPAGGVKVRFHRASG